MVNLLLEGNTPIRINMHECFVVGSLCSFSLESLTVSLVNHYDLLVKPIHQSFLYNALISFKRKFFHLSHF